MKIDKLYQDYKEKIENEIRPENAGPYSFVWGYGNTSSDVVLIGEAPGKDEVKLGRPFVGKAGAILDEFLEKTGIERSDLFITNTIKYRLARVKKGAILSDNENDSKNLANRPARPEEIRTGAELLAKELCEIKPKFVVTMGGVPLKAMQIICDLDKKKGIGDLHGTAIPAHIGDFEFVLYPIYHPASLIYNRELKPVYEEDLRKAKIMIKK